jgi:hypothetical protein
MFLYDTEVFLKDLETVLKDNLNTEITAINTEKGDFSIDTIETNAWFLQNLEERVFNYKQFVIWGMTEPSILSGQQNDNSIEEINVFVEIGIPDSGETTSENTFWKLLRYSRCLGSIVRKNFDKFQGTTKIRVEQLIPTVYEFKNNSFKSAGIRIIASKTAY